jgi:cell wall-associated NlpC family hydrolase
MKADHYPDSPARMPATPRFPVIRLAVLSASLCLLAACGSRQTVRRPPPPASHRDWPTVAPANPVAANNVTMRALGLVGTPYRYGGNTPESGFDCSGLVSYVYRDTAEIQLPRTSSALSQVQGPKIASQRLTAGDLVFFGSRGSVSHVGIYVGEGRFVHAPSTGGTVRLDRLDGAYWRDHYTGAKRILH